MEQAITDVDVSEFISDEGFDAGKPAEIEEISFDDFFGDEELVKKLPLDFRALRGQQISGDKLDELAELIRRT